MVQDQAPLPVIQELLRHSDFATTQLYLKVSHAQVYHYAQEVAQRTPVPKLNAVLRRGQNRSVLRNS